LEPAASAPGRSPTGKRYHRSRHRFAPGAGRRARGARPGADAGRGTGIVTSDGGDGKPAGRRLAAHRPGAIIFVITAQELAEMSETVSMDDYLRLPYAAHLDVMSQRLEQALGAAGL